jgi:hypothetical protein
VSSIGLGRQQGAASERLNLSFKGLVVCGALLARWQRMQQRQLAGYIQS